jgi:hypothetical protein
MKFLQNHALIPLGASKQDIEAILAKTSFRACKRTLSILTGDKEKLFRKGRNIGDIMEFETNEIAAVYNAVALTINYNVSRAIELIGQLIIILPKLKGVKTFQDAVGLLAQEEDDSEDDNA